VPHNPLFLAHFRWHQCLEGIHSEQWIGDVLEHYSKNADPGQVLVQKVLYEGRTVTHSERRQ
jgi:hypothetical protein